MVLDSSALVALILREPGYERLAEKMAAAHELSVGAPTLLETALVLGGKAGSDATAQLARVIDGLDVIVVAFGRRHFEEATRAWLAFGKGRHRAALNFGACMTYAVARITGEPLLALGDDFARTDLILA
jgi:ribonuclease VapC